MTRGLRLEAGSPLLCVVDAHSCKNYAGADRLAMMIMVTLILIMEPMALVRIRRPW